MPHPLVVHCKRAPYDVLCDRTTRWGNPFVVGRDGSREQVIRKYERHLDASPELLADLPSLRGKVLGCWCAPRACHCDVLARRANGPAVRRPRRGPDPVRRAARGAARAVFTVTTPADLARLWAAESRRPAPGGRWIDEAKRFLDWCVNVSKVDPARYVAALWDRHRASGGKYTPYLRSVRGPFARAVYEQWEARERRAADGVPAAEVSAARRIAASQRDRVNAPAPERAPRPVTRRRPKKLTDVLAEDARVFLARSAARPRLDANAVVDLDPMAYSAAFRCVVGYALSADVVDPLAKKLLDDRAARDAACDTLRSFGVPPDLFV